AQDVEAHVVGNPVEPRTERRPTFEMIEGKPSSEQGLLHGVVRVGRSDHPTADGREARPMTFELMVRRDRVCMARRPSGASVARRLRDGGHEPPPRTIAVVSRARDSGFQTRDAISRALTGSFGGAVAAAALIGRDRPVATLEAEISRTVESHGGLV